MRRVPCGLVKFALLASLGVACRGEATDGAGSPQPGDPAPGFTLPSAGGRTVSLSDFKGEQVLLYFSMGPG